MKRWYEEKNAHDLCNNIWATFKVVEGENTSILEMHRDHAMMYSNDMFVDDALSRNNPNINNNTGDLVFGKGKVTYNITQSIIDTITSKIGVTKPHIQFLTSGGDVSLRQRAKDASRFVSGVFNDAGLYRENGKLTFKNALTYGTGILKWYADHKGRIKCERVLPSQVFVDRIDSQYGEPRQYFQIRLVDKTTLKKMFPDKAREIEQSKTYLPHINNDAASYQEAQSRVSDMIRVVEAWHLPSGCGEEDGRHTITAEGVVLFDDQEYNNHMGPFTIYRWLNRPVGFWGIGISEQLRGIQTEINQVAYNIQRAIHLVSKPYMFIEERSKITPDKIDNDRDRLSVVYYKGQPPNLKNFEANNPEMYRYLESLFQKAFEIVGASQASATSRKEPGLVSGIALQTVLDIETERFLEAEQAWQEFYVDCAKQVLFLSGELEDVETDYAKGDVYYRIKYQDFSKYIDSLQVKAYPISMLPKKPEGRLERVSQMMEGGLLSAEDGLQLLDFPDIERHMKLKLAPRLVIEKIVEKILEEGEYTPPDKYMDLEYAARHATESYYLAKFDEDASDENLGLLLMFRTEVDKKIEEVQMEAMQKQQMMNPQEQQAPPTDEGVM